MLWGGFACVYPELSLGYNGYVIIVMFVIIINMTIIFFDNHICDKNLAYIRLNNHFLGNMT